jgi:ubiquitin carboxyl-terminal hydrolase 2
MSTLPINTEINNTRWNHQMSSYGFGSASSKQQFGTQPMRTAQRSGSSLGRFYAPANLGYYPSDEPRGRAAQPTFVSGPRAMSGSASTRYRTEPERSPERPPSTTQWSSPVSRAKNTISTRNSNAADMHSVPHSTSYPLSYTYSISYNNNNYSRPESATQRYADEPHQRPNYSDPVAVYSPASASSVTRSRATEAIPAARDRSLYSPVPVASSPQLPLRESRAPDQNDILYSRRLVVQRTSLPRFIPLTSPLGLPNLGNTCYLNSVLQCVLRLRSFIEELWREQTAPTPRRAPVVEATVQLAQESSPSQRRTIVSSIKSLMGKRNSEFASYDQADAHELLRTFLFALHEELNRRTHPVAYEELKDIPGEDARETQYRWATHHKRRDDSIVYDYFGGIVKASTTCKFCKHCSLAFDPFLDLSLPFPRTTSARGDDNQVLDMLLGFLQEEDIDTIQAWKCGQCKTVRSAIRKQEFLQYPKILVLHLKRFNSRGVKVEANALYSERLVIFSATFMLKAVVCHSGSALSGHYTAYVCSGSRVDWSYCSDNIIQSSTTREVLGASSTVFMLFYELYDR